jgi:predicted SAM-dependent methyltransferase
MDMFKNIAKNSLYSLYKDYQHQKLKKRALHIIDNYFKDWVVAKFHIGAGGSWLEGWLNVDIEPLEERIAFMDVSRDFPLSSNSFQYVFSEHLLEHLDIPGQVKMLSECYRILKPGGRIRIATPNVDVLLSLRGDKSEFAQRYISWSADEYFPQYKAILGTSVKSDIFVINNYFYSWGHKFIHNKETFKEILTHSGFKCIDEQLVNQSEHRVFAQLERHGTVIPKQYNEFETMVFEAIK